MKVGVSVWLDPIIAATEKNSNETHGYRIGYTKIKDKWRIAAKLVKRTEVTEEVSLESRSEVVDMGVPIALVKAPRVVRVRAIQHLEKLVEKLAVRVQYFLDFIKNSKKAAEPANLK
jgi:hypothetical protein